MCYRVTAAVAVASAYVSIHAVRLFFPRTMSTVHSLCYLFLCVLRATYIYMYVLNWLRDCVYVSVCVSVCIPLHTYACAEHRFFVRCLLLLLLLFFGAAKIVELKFIYKYFDIYEQMCLNHIEICMEAIDRLNESHVQKCYLDDFVATIIGCFVSPTENIQTKSFSLKTF